MTTKAIVATYNHYVNVYLFFASCLECPPNHFLVFRFPDCSNDRGYFYNLQFLLINFARRPLSCYPNFDLLVLDIGLNFFVKHYFKVTVCSSTIGDLLSIYCYSNKVLRSLLTLILMFCSTLPCSKCWIVVQNVSVK